MLHKILIRYILIVVLYGFSSLSQSAPAYTVQLLPGFGARSGSTRFTTYLGFDGLLNDKGQIAGTFNDRSAIWSNGVVTELRDFGSSLVINNNGQVAITSGVEPGYPDLGDCCLWSNGTLLKLGGLNVMGTGCWPTGMNAAGQVIGASIVSDINNIYRGFSVFLWSNGTMTNLDTFENGDYGEYGEYGGCSAIPLDNGSGCSPIVSDTPVDINDSGQVLFIRRNSASRLVPNPPPPGPVVWTNGVTIPLPQEVYFKAGKSINNRGDILGYFNDKSFLIWNVNNGTS